MAWFRKSSESVTPELLREKLPADIRELLEEIIHSKVSALTTSLTTTGIVTFSPMEILADWCGIFQEDASKQSKRSWQRIQAALFHSSVTPASRLELSRVAALAVQYIGAPLFYGWWNRGLELLHFVPYYPAYWPEPSRYPLLHYHDLIDVQDAMRATLEMVMATFTHSELIAAFLNEFGLYTFPFAIEAEDPEDDVRFHELWSPSMIEDIYVPSHRRVFDVLTLPSYVMRQLLGDAGWGPFSDVYASLRESDPDLPIFAREESPVIVVGLCMTILSRIQSTVFRTLPERSASTKELIGDIASTVDQWGPQAYLARSLLLGTMRASESWSESEQLYLTVESKSARDRRNEELLRTFKP